MNLLAGSIFLEIVLWYNDIGINKSEINVPYMGNIHFTPTKIFFAIKLLWNKSRSEYQWVKEQYMVRVCYGNTKSISGFEEDKSMAHT